MIRAYGIDTESRLLTRTAPNHVRVKSVLIWLGNGVCGTSIHPFMGVSSSHAVKGCIELDTPFLGESRSHAVTGNASSILSSSLHSPSPYHHLHAHMHRRRRRYAGAEASCPPVFVHILSLSSTRLPMSTLPCSRTRRCSVSNASPTPRISGG